jgi:inorganic pyrophosphatase
MIKMFVQVAAGSCDRNIYNERTLEYLETRPGTLPYPYPYGFIIGTSAEDGACVDCYLITRDQVTSGTIVECEPAGLLLQDEGGEIDHKVLAVMPGQVVELGPELVQELQEFIYAIFARAALDMEIRVGPLLSREAAQEHLQKSLQNSG